MHSEGAPFADLALHGQAAIHQLQQMAGDIQPKPGTLAQLAFAGQLGKRFKDRFQLVGRDALAGIENVTAENAPPLMIVGHTQGHAPLLGILDRVGEQVQQDLAQFALIPAYVLR
ncbi:MAG TPA: hypothetical protein DER40_13325 [Geobacter sp.]|nr:hypothetical protein [Geobacter sp.]